MLKQVFLHTCLRNAEISVLAYTYMLSLYIYNHYIGAEKRGSVVAYGNPLLDECFAV